MPGLGTVVLRSSWLVSAVHGLPALSPDQVTFQMRKTHGPDISLVAWRYGIFYHVESNLILSGVGRLA